MSKNRNLLLGSALALVSFLISFGAVEAALRFAYLDSPWATRNFAIDRVNQQVSNFAIQYDPIIGYIARPDFRGAPTNTHGKMGVRLNYSLPAGAPSPEIPTGGILAVGDSFTFGSEVNDDQSWPAQLEKILGIPVVNGGAGGYGIDQAELRAEQLVDIVKPKAIIVSFIPNCVGRNEYSVNTGLIKSYFEIVDGKLELRNTPVPDYQPTVRYAGFIRFAFGYSYAITWALERVGLGKFWYATESEVRRVHQQGQEVTCLLWRRLAQHVAGRNIRLIALAQYAGIQVNGHDNARKSYGVEKLLACAKSEGYAIVDSYPELRRRFEANEKTFWNLWVREPYDKDWHTGHMSAEGNRLTAELLATAIRSEMPQLLSAK